jgi:hypothetical protein
VIPIVKGVKKEEEDFAFDAGDERCIRIREPRSRGKADIPCNPVSKTELKSQNVKKKMVASA